MTKGASRIISTAMAAARKDQLAVRFLLYVVGLFVLALGISFTINSELGLPPINSLPFIVSVIAGVDIGICVVGWLLLMTIAQCIIAREIKWIVVVQLLFSFMFGYFINFTIAMLGGFALPTYLGQLVMQGIGIILVALGIVLYMEAGLVVLPADGIVVAITRKIPGSAFHRVKIAMDSSIVLVGMALSVVFLSGLYGIREGTVVSAVMIGKAMPFARKMATPIFRRIGLCKIQMQQVENLTL